MQGPLTSSDVQNNLLFQRDQRQLGYGTDQTWRDQGLVITGPGQQGVEAFYHLPFPPLCKGQRPTPRDKNLKPVDSNVLLSIFLSYFVQLWSPNREKPLEPVFQTRWMARMCHSAAQTKHQDVPEPISQPISGSGCDQCSSHFVSFYSTPSTPVLLK